MSVSHEDIRYKVLSKLRDSISHAIDHIRTSKPQIYLKLRQQLEEYKELIDFGQDIPLIINNEKIIKDIGIPDIEVFGGRILIEVKVKPSEFKDGFEQLSRYVTFYPYGKYAILTNYDYWKFYEVKNGKLAKAGVGLEDIVQLILIEDVKVALSTENVRNMFKPIIPLEDELHQIFEEDEVRTDALFEAYFNIMERLYEKASDGEIEKLFIKHTLMQMIVSACLTVSSQKKTTPRGACSGANIEAEIVLPYLKWWESLEKTPEHEKFLNSLAGSVYSRAMLLDWESDGEDDVFRELYEILIEPDIRRKIGEYYTPLWLVEFMIEKLSEDVKDLKGKTVLDPFCGSGTFLVTAFYRKVQEGEDPDDAIKQVIGFDINPLAVSIARAELMIAYQSKTKGIVTPLVFNTDSASLLLRSQGKWQSSSFLEELRTVEKKIAYVDSPIYASNELDFSELLKIEMILRDCFRETAQSGKFEEELQSRLHNLEAEEWKGGLTSLIVTTLAEDKSIDAISQLIKKYGDGVWAVSITSLFAPHVIRKVKVDAVITNPPWAQLTEPKGSYGELIREKAKELLEGYEKTGQILNGSDISSVLLHGCTTIAKSGVAFLMPDEVVYTAGSYYGLGKILTFNVAKNYRGNIMQVGFDAFQHGRLPSAVFLKKEAGRIRCYSMSIEWKGEYSKALRLSDVKFKLTESEDYENFIKNVVEYTEISSEEIKKRLKVEEVVPRGDYIMGLFGGKKKKGAKRYAGLVFEIVRYDRTAGQYSIRLSNMDTSIKIPEYYLKQFWKKLIYGWKIFPFHFDVGYNILLSSNEKKNLEEILEKHILSRVSGEDKVKIKLLMEECKQPKMPNFLDETKNYVVYRSHRTFASIVVTPEVLEQLSENGRHEIVISGVSSYVITESKPEAYYYSAILNYLAYKTIQIGGAFERRQFTRPLITILNAGLEWKDSVWQRKVSVIGRQLHEQAPKCFENFIRKGIQVAKCFERLETCDKTQENFKELIQIIDQHVDKKKLYESLRFVCKLN